MKELVLLRGLPGSGKSTVAKRDYKGHVHLESDEFRYNSNGVYVYSRATNLDAHAWCKYQAMYHLNKDLNVVVSNVFCLLQNIAPYVEIAENYKASLKILEVKGDYTSIHNVPEAEMERLRVTWEDLPDSWRGDYN